jgi:sRNA-binding protein
MGFISSLFGGKNDNSAKDAAAEAAKKQADLEAQRAAEIAKQKQDTENNTTRDAAMKKQKQQAAGATGTRDTVLSGPLGDTTYQQQPDKSKTLLGL